MCSVEVQTMYYYFPERFMVGVKTQRAWRKQHFLASPYFECLLFYHYYHQNCELIRVWESSILHEFRQNKSIKQNQLRLPFNLWWKNFEDDVESRKHEVSFPNDNFSRFSLHRGAIDHLPTFIFVWNDQNIPSIILSMQISAIFELMLFKNK